uniref:RNase NYN domain-containing protein n=1 Tax=Panagrolaimus sp. ES5 TaxID=591445 RepID=A0AC34FQT5_9BILA
MYILEELNKMQLIIYPEKDFVEADDIMMLQIAERYGAKIISNDAFSNHPKYQTIAKKYTIRYKKKPNPNFSFEEFKLRLIFENKFCIEGEEEDMFCMLNDPDYKKVEESHNVFWQLTIIDKKIFDLLWKYVYCGICFEMGFKISSSIKFMND